MHEFAGIPLNADAIRDLLPHRFPYLLLDKITQLVPSHSAVGVKNVSVNEPYFQGHFPQRFILPGAVIIETTAQLTAIFFAAALAKQGTRQARIGYLAAVRDFKFLKPVMPGDQLIIKVQQPQIQGSMARVDAQASVDDVLVAKGALWVAADVESTFS